MTFEVSEPRETTLFIAKSLQLQERGENFTYGITIKGEDTVIGTASLFQVQMRFPQSIHFYELGYAHGIGHEGNNVLLIAKEGTKLHFDLSHLHVRPYKSLEDLNGIVYEQMKKLIEERDTEVND